MLGQHKGQQAERENAQAVRHTRRDDNGDVTAAALDKARGGNCPDREYKRLRRIEQPDLCVACAQADGIHIQECLEHAEHETEESYLDVEVPDVLCLERWARLQPAAEVSEGQCDSITARSLLQVSSSHSAITRVS